MKKISIKKYAKYTTIALIIFFFIAWCYNFFSSNFHKVIRHEVYRSAQLDKKNLLYYIKKYRIHSILNLRGTEPKQLWYQQEINIAKTYNIKHYDLGLAPHSLPKLQQLNTLISILMIAPKPILIHCYQGADRTGLAAALSLILANDHSWDDVSDEVSWQYNVYSPNTIGYKVLENYRHFIHKNHLPQSKQSLLLWLNSNPLLINYSGWYFT